MYTLEFDGMLKTTGHYPEGCGVLGYGWSFSRNGIEIAYGFGLFIFHGKINSIHAEYIALSEGLDAIRFFEIGDESVLVRGDARSVIDQMRGKSGVNTNSTKRLFNQTRKLASKFQKLNWEWVPRSENRTADRLSRKGLGRISTTSITSLFIDQFTLEGRHGEKLVPVIDLMKYDPLLNYSNN
jgi:ribonuclease HI